MVLPSEAILMSSVPTTCFYMRLGCSLKSPQWSNSNEILIIHFMEKYGKLSLNYHSISTWSVTLNWPLSAFSFQPFPPVFVFSLLQSFLLVLLSHPLYCRPLHLQDLPHLQLEMRQRMSKATKWHVHSLRLHDKTNKMTCAPREDSDQPGHPPSLIRVVSVHFMRR